MTEQEAFLTDKPSLHQLKVYFIIYLANKGECPSPPRGNSECKWRLRAPELQKQEFNETTFKRVMRLKWAIGPGGIQIF